MWGTSKYIGKLTFPFLLAISFLALPVSRVVAEDFNALIATISTATPEYGLVLSPDSNTAVFARMSLPWGQKDNQSHLYETRRTDNGWSKPKQLFSGNFVASDPFFSNRESKLYFVAKRTMNGAYKPDSDIWVADIVDGNFENPRPITEINSDSRDTSPIETGDGSLYFSSSREGGFGAGDIWVARYKNGLYQPPENLGPQVNTPNGEWNVFVNPTETIMILEASGRKSAMSSYGDLYKHNRLGNSWSPPIALQQINTTGSDLMPRLTPDGGHFLYASTGYLAATDTQILAAPFDRFLTQNGSYTGSNDVLLVASRSAREIVALNPNSLDEIARYPTGPGVHELAVAADGTTVYAPNYGVYPKPHKGPILPSQMQFMSEPSETLSKINIRDKQSNTEVQICSRSHGVTVSPDGHVWVTCQNEGLVMELDGTGSLIKNWQAGDKGSHILVATRNNKYVVTSNVSAGSISILDRSSGETQVVKTAKGAEGLILTPDHKHVWVGNTQANTISVVRIEDGTLLRSFSSHGKFPVKMAMKPDGDEVWVVNTFSNEIAIIDGATGALRNKLTFDSPPLGIIMSHSGDVVYATFPRLNQVRAFDRAVRAELARTSSVMEGDGMAWSKSSTN